MTNSPAEPQRGQAGEPIYQKKREDARGAFIAVVPLSIVLLIGAPFGIMQCAKGLSTYYWSPAPGTLQSVSTYTPPSSGRRQSAAYIVWNFAYVVQGREYQGTDCRQGNSWAIGAKLNAHMSPGTPLTVYYNPDNIAEVRVARGLNSNESAALAMTLTGVGFFLLTLVIWVQRYRELAKWRAVLGNSVAGDGLSSS